jgi:hypothetical protein
MPCTHFTYKYNGGSETVIPGGIFTKPDEFQIDVASTSIADTGSYVITITVSDDFPSSITTSFTVNVTNAAPRVTSPAPSHSMVHGDYKSMPLAEYFVDDDGDLLTMTATYSLNGGSA